MALQKGASKALEFNSLPRWIWLLGCQPSGRLNPLKALRLRFHPQAPEVDHHSSWFCLFGVLEQPILHGFHQPNFASQPSFDGIFHETFHDNFLGTWQWLRLNHRIRPSGNFAWTSLHFQCGQLRACWQNKVTPLQYQGWIQLDPRCAHDWDD